MSVVLTLRVRNHTAERYEYILPMGTLSFDPLIPPALWLTLTVVGAALLVWYALRRPAGLSRRLWTGIVMLMAGGLAVVLFVLLNPTWIEPIASPSGLPRLTVLVDESASMATTDAAAGASRFQAAAGLAQRCADDLRSRFDVHVAVFAESTTPTTPELLVGKLPQAAGTNLASAIARSLDADVPAGHVMLLVSDGIHNAGAANQVLEAARLAKAAATPVYTRTIGGDVAVQDLALEIPTPQDLAFINQSLSLSVQLRQRGLPGRKAAVILEHDGQVVERRELTISGPDSSIPVSFTVQQPKAGLYRYEVRVEALEEEVSRSNNSGTFLLRVIDRPIRVLLLEGKPYWDAKFFARTLLADPATELESIVRLGQSRYISRSIRRDGAADGNEALAVTEDVSTVLADESRLKDFQVVVLGRDADAFLSDAALASLKSWLARDGGSLVCYRGQPTAQINQRLGQLLPVRWAPVRETRFHLSPTERGREVRWLPDDGAARATLSTSSRAETPKPLAIVLASARSARDGAEEPAITYQPYGSGRVVVIEGAGMWRWSFLPPQRQENDAAYRMLWHGLLRWLTSGADLRPGQTLALRGDKVRFGVGEPASATLFVREEAVTSDIPQIELTGDRIDGSRLIRPSLLGDEPGVFRVGFGPLPEGRYRAKVAGAAADDPTTQIGFDVRNTTDERLDLRARPDLMARLAHESGAVMLDGDDARADLRQFEDHRAKSTPRRVVRLAAWDRWWVLGGIIGIWAVTWGRRRASGLV